ncbi:unnamed protein product [Triticum turgidum subsp. durum]|uniref:CCHC-type domain-containing protein n=1 Tax=Triticum turgidum subsp. durum TaxID=4567 RepID=A0A9R1Q1D9_TRITD|nr:unnamed protein product [Triticum turgidum subsp. durum]
MIEAEGEGLQSMMAAETETEVEMAEEWKLARESECRLRNCECRWRCLCSPRIPRVAPGMDYSSTPAGAGGGADRPAWSLLVGLKDGAVLRLKRLRVARSGRILGRSDDALEAFHDIKTPTGRRFNASAALAPDGRSLCVLRQEDDGAGEQPHALHLTLQQPETDTSPEHLPLPPEIQAGRSRNCMPISAAGHIFALCPIVEYGVKFSLLMRPLHPLPEGGGGGQWEQVGQDKHDKDSYRWLGGGFLQGYAVLPGPLILVSLKQDRGFFTVAPGSGSRDWTPVLTDETRPRRDYAPIVGRGVYMEQDNAIYMLRGNTIYAYKLSYIHQDQGDDQGRGRLRLDPPITIDSVCPYSSGHGCGFLTRLDGRLMCSVWISLAPRQQLEDCRCDNLHAIVTTFNLQDPAQGGIEVLHSSFRQVDMEPNRANPEDQEFCFLQEYEDKDCPVLLQHQQGQEKDLTSCSQLQHVDQPSKMLDCCSLCFSCGTKGHVARDCSLPPQQPLPAMPHRTLVGRASMQHRVPFERRPVATTTSINKDLFIICQAGSQLVIYHTGVLDETSLLQGGGDDGKPLQPSCYVATYVRDDDYWHFFLHSGSKIRAISREKDGMLEFSLNKDRTMATDRLPVRRLPSADTFVLFITVCGETIALTDTLKVFHQPRFSYGSSTWLLCKTDQSHVLHRKVMISGYVAVNDDSFIVCDALTGSCLLFDLGAKQWRVVMPWAAFAEDLPRTSPTKCPLNGRCVSVDGFIYTCRDGGLAAYRLLDKDHSVYLSEPILLPFSWLVDDCVGEDMCLDYAGKDVDSGAILFYVVQLQSGYRPPRHDVQITIVQVKTKATTSSKKREPVRVAPVDCVTRFIHHEEAVVDARCCFAL